MSDAREQADHAADRIRDDLLTTLKELDRRRTRVTDWRYMLSEHKTAIAISASVVAGLVAAGVGLVIARREFADRRRVQRRWEALARAWRHPERLATQADQAPPVQDFVRKVLVAFGVAVAARAGKRAAAAMVPTSPKQPAGESYLH